MLYTHLYSEYLDPTDFRHGWAIFGPLIDKNIRKGELSRAPRKQKGFQTFFVRFWDINLKFGIYI